MRISPIALTIVLQTSSSAAFTLYVPKLVTSYTSSSSLRASTLEETTINGAEKQVFEKNDNNESSTNNSNDDSKQSLTDQLASSSVAAAALAATAAVNAAVSMKSLSAPDVNKSYISLDTSDVEMDEEGLPLRYDKDKIELYWKKERGALNQRWAYFVGKAVPFLTRLVTLFIADGKIEDRHVPGLAKQAREDMQDLGPTFIKLGQMMSVRPDVLPKAALEELAVLQDSVIPFDTQVAIQQIEKELNGPLGQFFTSISEKPVAAASLAQVYLATLNDGNDTEVAVKVQRPDVLSTVSKDLYVLRRAAEVFQGLAERFIPQQRTNYVALLNEWAIGFYTELDFMNEANNQERLRDIILDNEVPYITVPKVYRDLCTRRILVSEWMDGVKLSDCSPEKIAEVTPYAQEAFLVQLFSEGFFHADPHPGNLLLLNESSTKTDAKLALIDCGLMASIQQDDRDNMISAVIHLANKDYASLVDDFMKLKILPEDSDRAAIVPLMDKALSPYVKGGGAKKYEEELKKMYGMEEGSIQSQVGGFQAMTQDALTVMNDIPFSIPPYFAILGRAIVTLEGVALTGDESYGIIMESYPFIARKLLREDRPEIQRALQEVLYSGDDNASGALKFTRLIALLNNASGSIEKKEGGAFVDLDAVPEDGLEFADGLKYLLSDEAESLRNLLEDEVDNLVDIIMRQVSRKGLSEFVLALTPPRPPSLPFFGDILPPSPKLDEVPLPLLLPGKDGSTSTPSLALLTMKDFVDSLAPKLSQDDEVYAIGIAEAADEVFGPEIASFVRGDGILSTDTVQLLLQSVQSGLFGRLGDSTVVPQLVGAVETLLNTFGGSSNDNTKNALNVLDELGNEERARFDVIVEELVQRSLNRATERLSGIARIA